MTFEAFENFKLNILFAKVIDILNVRTVFHEYKLYGIRKELYGEKVGLEGYSSKRTNELFDFEDKIILYDLIQYLF